jgi:hypothetical protein
MFQSGIYDYLQYKMKHYAIHCFLELLVFSLNISLTIAEQPANRSMSYFVFFYPSMSIFR